MQSLDIDTSASFRSASDPREVQVRQRSSTTETPSKQSLSSKSLARGTVVNVLNLEGTNDDDDGEEKISGLATLITLIGAMIGAGIMALPQLPVKGGCVLASLLTVFTGISTIEAGIVFFDTVYRHNEMAKRDTNYKKIKTFEDYGREGAGALGSMFVRISVTIWFIGLCSGYFILLAQQIKGLGDVLYVPDISYRACVLLVLPVLWVLSLQRDTAAIARLMPLATAGGVVSCLVIITMGIWDSSCWSHWKHSIHTIGLPEDMTFLKAASMYATLNGAYAVVANLPSVAGAMAEPAEFPWVYKANISITTVLNLCVMLAGHYGWGSFLQDSIVDSMMYNPASYEESLLNHTMWTGPKAVILPRVMILAVTVNIILSYPLCLMCVFLSVENTEFGLANLPVGSKKSYIMRSTTVALTGAIAFSTENFADVFALFSSVCGPVQGIFFVFLFARKIRQQSAAPEYGVPRKAFHVVLMVCAVFCIVFGLYDSTMNLLNPSPATSEPLSGGTPAPTPNVTEAVLPGKNTVQAAMAVISRF